MTAIPIRDEGFALVMRCRECSGIRSAVVETGTEGTGWDDRIPITDVRIGPWCQGCWKRPRVLERDEDGMPARLVL